MDKLNCKLQAHVRVCKESKLELELELDKSDAYWNNFVVKMWALRAMPYTQVITHMHLLL